MEWAWLISPNDETPNMLLKLLPAWFSPFCLKTQMVTVAQISVHQRGALATKKKTTKELFSKYLCVEGGLADFFT